MILPTLCRTALFTPANRADRYEKAGTLSCADGVILDLEDAVPLAEKHSARQTLINYLKAHKNIPANHPMMTAVRVNSISTLAGIKDLAAFVDAGIQPDAFFLPKVQNRQEIELYATLLNQDALKPVMFIALIETAYGMQYAHEIASHPQVLGLAFGGGDLAVDLGAKLNFDSTIAYRSRIIQAAKYAGKSAWDVPYLNIKDEKGLRIESKRAKDLGFDAKLAIHPVQLAPIVEIFSPTDDEIKEAKAIVDTYKKANGSACEYQGKMLDVPVVKKCEELLEKMKHFSEIKS